MRTRDPSCKISPSWRRAIILIATASIFSSGCESLGTLALPSELRRPPAASETLRLQHDAVFDLFLPIGELALPDSLEAMAHALRDSMWEEFSTSRRFLEAMTLLTRLDVMSARSAQVRSFLARTGMHRLDQLSREERANLVMLMQTCGDNGLRRLALHGRSYYIAMIYGSRFGARVADIEPKVVTHPKVEAFARANTPRLPPTWLRYDRSGRQMKAQDGRLDYIIVGSGPAGSVIAHELQRAGMRTLLIEKGSFVIPGAMDTRKFSRLKESTGLRTTVSGSVLLNNAQAVGGGTTVNIDLAFSPAEEIIAQRIDRWRADGRIATDAFTRPEIQEAYEWVKDKIGTRTPRETEINRNNAVLWEGARKLGMHPELYDLNTRKPGEWASPVSDKRSAVSGLLLEAMAEPSNPLAMVSDAEVLKVLTEKRNGTLNAIGVSFVVRPSWNVPGVIHDPSGLNLPLGDTVTVLSDRIVLCAGTLGSATLLLRSGFRNPNIGRGIVVHPSMPVIGEFDHRIDAFQGTEATVHVDDDALSHGFLLEAMSADPVYAALMTPGVGRDVFRTVSAYRNLAGFGVLLIDTPSNSNRITLDQAGQPVVHYELGQGDRKRFRFAIGEAIRIMFLAGAREVIIPTSQYVVGEGRGGALRPLRLTRIEQADSVARGLDFRPNETILTSAHMQSSNKMGASPRTSVVSHQARVWGCENLYVMDSSVFPSSIGANPMQSIYTFAKIFADRIVEGRPRH